ncbi:MAG: hypothetical protein R3E12_06420 [Candidatus Eisenbacteria bacterium]
MRLNFRTTGLASLLLGFATVLGCAGANAGEKRLTNADLSIISFGSINGEIAPCG